MESILTTIKKMIGFVEEYKPFDPELIIFINTQFVTLHQLGVGPENPAVITSETDTWRSVFGDIKELEAIKTYVYIKTKLVFDPPSSTALIDAYKRSAEELEWRLANRN